MFEFLGTIEMFPGGYFGAPHPRTRSGRSTTARGHDRRGQLPGREHPRGLRDRRRVLRRVQPQRRCLPGGHLQPRRDVVLGDPGDRRRRAARDRERVRRPARASSSVHGREAIFDPSRCPRRYRRPRMCGTGISGTPATRSPSRCITGVGRAAPPVRVQPWPLVHRQHRVRVPDRLDRRRDPRADLPHARTPRASSRTYGFRTWSAPNLLTAQGRYSDGSTTTGLVETGRFAEYKVKNYQYPRDRIATLGFRPLRPDDERARRVHRLAREGRRRPIRST